MDEGVILERLQRENRELREEVNRLRKELEEKESRINELEGENDGLKEEINELKEENQRLRRMIFGFKSAKKRRRGSHTNQKHKRLLLDTKGPHANARIEQIRPLSSSLKLALIAVESSRN